MTAVTMTLTPYGAAGEVTGSNHLVEFGDHRLLIDCGLIQGSYQDERRNRDPFPYPIDSIDAVILTHAHLDHSGRLPLLVRQGFRGPIYAHEATIDLCRIMLRDAAYINEKETEWENRKRERKGLQLVAPLYNRDDVDACLELFIPLRYGDEQALLPGAKIRLNDAGHILGASIVELWIEHGGQRRKLVLSGDLGHRGAPVMRDPAIIRSADWVVLESTYGDRCHRGWRETWAELAEVIRRATERGGNILIPAFAVGRTQDLLHVFRLHYKEWGLDRWQIFLDSPLAIEATAIYRRHPELYEWSGGPERGGHDNPFGLPNLRLSRTAEESMAINRIRSGAIVIAGSGMCDGGRIKHHFKHNIWRNDCHVVIVGFQAQGTLGRRLVDGAHFIRLWGETVRVAAEIHTIGGLSAHAGQNGLIEWYRQFTNRPPVILVHGEESARETLAGMLRDPVGARVLTPTRGERLDL